MNQTSSYFHLYIRKPGDVEHAIGLLRRSYDLAMTQKAKSRSGAAALAA